MALATHQLQGSYASISSRPLSLRRGKELKHSTLRVVRKTDNNNLLRWRFCLNVGIPLVHGPKRKSLKISAFKGISPNNELGGEARGSKAPKNSVQLSYLPQGSEESVSESSKLHTVPVPCTPDADGTTMRSRAIKNLFKHWLTLLRTPSESQVVDETPRETSGMAISEAHKEMQKKETVGILNTVLCYFLHLDATIKIPLSIFVPLFLAVNVTYGAEVSKELTPLWVLGPLIVALYVKLFQGLCALYVFTFKQTVKVAKNLPPYCLLAYDYIFRGKLKEEAHAYLWQRLVGSKDANYRELSKRMLKFLRDWVFEKYLDFMEAIWPFYCNVSRILKKARLI